METKNLQVSAETAYIVELMQKVEDLRKCFEGVSSEDALNSGYDALKDTLDKCEGQKHLADLQSLGEQITHKLAKMLGVVADNNISLYGRI